MAGPDILIRQLSEKLAEELKMYRELASILRQKQKTIIANNLGDLQDTMILEQDLLEEIALLAGVRDTLSLDLGHLLGLRDKRITLTKLIAKIDNGEEDVLTVLRDDMKKELETIQQINRENAKLLEFAIFSIHELVGTIMGFRKNEAPVYTLTGTLQKSTAESTIFNVKI